MKICVKHNVVPWFFRKRTELDIRWPWVWVQTGAQSLCMALGRSLNLSVLLHIYKTQMLKPSIGYRVNIQQTFAEGLLHAKPCSEQRGGLEETAVLWHSQADRPDEGATDAEPGGVINSSFQEALSFLKHMSEDLI